MSENNGAAPLPEAERIAEQLRELVEARKTALAQYDLQRTQMVAELRTYEKALNALRGERPRGRPRKEQSASAPRTKTMGEERMADIERLVREYAADHEEFRQVDIRSAYGTLPDGGTFTSGMSAIAFEELRQRNVLRVARIDGNSKWYRLTREALNV